MIGWRELIGWDWDLRLHRGSFLLGVGVGAAVGAAAVAISHARRQRMRRPEDGRMPLPSTAA